MKNERGGDGREGCVRKILLKSLLEDLGHVAEAASHHAAENVVEFILPRPFFLHVVNLENTVRRNTVDVN